MSPNAIRIIVQLLLAGPALLLLPISLVVSGAGLFSLGSGDKEGALMVLMILPAALALAALLASIVLPLPTICKRRWLLWSIRIVLGLGMLIAAVLLFNTLGSDEDLWGALLYIWFGAGSVAVAVWNLFRMRVHARQSGQQTPLNG